MRRSRSCADRLADETGSASVEFLAAGLLLLLPSIYLVLVIAAVHGAALATEGAARQGARVFVRADTQAEARARLADAVAVTLADYGVDPASTRVRIDCAPDPQDCLARGGSVTVHIDARVDLPLVPAVLDVAAPASIPIEAAATQPVSRFRSGG